jgi:pimeloyl-ACP methyl ester carboxylesterase
MFNLNIKKYGLVLLAFFFVPFVASADCGNITILEQEEIDWDELYNDDGEFIGGDIEPSFIEITTPIEDCGNPFNADESVDYIPTLFVNEEEVVNGTTIFLPEGEPVFFDFLFSGSRSFFNGVNLFKKSGPDYVEPFMLMREDLVLDGLEAGDYVIVFRSEDPPTLVWESATWKQKIKNLFLPITAHAFYPDYQRITTISFSVENTTPEPTGASSVLFLPGIQASRLYTEGVLGTENQLWVPNRDNDVEKLSMDMMGESINDIYTRDVVDEAVSVNIYKSFLGLLDDLQVEGVIKEYQPFAYDWRYDVFHVATKPVAYPDGESKLLFEEVKRLAAESYTGKVTIVAHSNGGLVAKALLHEYGGDELAGLVDKIVMVGTPQLGTPKAIGSLLHGLDQSLALGLLGRQVTARNTTQFMPGAYGLLPTSKYFDKYGVEIITVDDSLIAEPLSSYGDLGDYANFSDFLVDKKSTRNTVTDLSQPISLDPDILSRTVEHQIILDNWVAPEGVEVYEVAGTGLATVSGFNYRGFSCTSESTMCALIPFLKPVPVFTVEGDATVVLDSAISYEGDRRSYVVDLKQEGEGLLNKERQHADLTESPSVKQFIESVIKYPYQTDAIVATEFGQISHKYKIIGVHSPVSIVVRNNEGQEVGIVNGEIKEEVIGSSYFEFAGSKYVIVPADEDILVFLQGEADGRYSLTIEDLSEEDGQTLLQEILGATSTAGMIAEFECLDGVCGEFVVDYDADGEIDVRFDWSGNYQDFGQNKETVSEVLEGGGNSKSSATRVGDRLSPSGLVAGAMTTNQNDELLRMWGLLIQIQMMIEDLKLYYN